MNRATATFVLLLLLAGGYRAVTKQKDAAAKLLTKAVMAPVVAMQRDAAM